MNKQTILALVIIGGIFSFLYLFFFLQDDWSVKYEINDSEPRNTSILYQLLKTKYDVTLVDDEATYDSIKEQYLFVNEHFYLDNVSTEKLFTKVDEGLNAYIFTNYLGEDFQNKILEEDQELYNDFYKHADSLNVSLNNQNYTFFTRFKSKKRSISIRYFNNNLTFKYPVKIIGEFHGNPLGYEFQVGKGKLYIFNQPELLMNYFMVDKSKRTFYNDLFSNLNQEKLYFDQYHSTIRRTNNSKYKQSSASSPYGSFLSYIFNHKALKWTWYLFMFGTLFYIIFNLKRKQSIIPIVYKKENQAILLNKHLGKVLFKKSTRASILNENIKLFEVFLKKKYKVSLTAISIEDMEVISLKSGIHISEIKEIINKMISLQLQSEISKFQLVEFYNLLNEFYKNAK